MEGAFSPAAKATLHKEKEIREKERNSLIGKRVVMIENDKDFGT